MIVLTAENLKKIEKLANDFGISYLDMMETAARDTVKAITERVEVAGKNVAVVAGSGNNGGDGYGIARLLENAGAFVRVLAMDAPITETAKAEKERFGGEVVEFEASYLYEADIIVDALFGIGLSRPLSGKYETAVKSINGSSAYTVAVDIPSGLFADSGEADVCVKADLTVTFIANKICRVLHPAAEFFGEIVFSDLNLPRNLFKEADLVGEIIPPPVFEKRRPNTHKGSYGTLSLICGSYGMAGAALLSTKSALRCGVGIAKLTLPSSVYSSVTGFVPEAVCNPYDQNGDMEAVAKTALKKADAVLIGCGLSTALYAQNLFKEVINNCNIPLVIDADGLNILSLNIECIKSSKADIVLTPHSGEMARLMGVTAEEIEKDRIGYAKTLSEKLSCTVVLKGSITVVASSGRVYFNVTGNSGMATGGSGDVLAGMIAAFCATGMKCTDAAVTAVYLHGAAGDKASAAYGEISALPSDTINFLPELFKQFGER